MADTVSLSPHPLTPDPGVVTSAAVRAPDVAAPNLEVKPRLARLGLALASGVVISALTLFQPAGLGWSLAVVVGALSWIAFARLRGRTMGTGEWVVLGLMTAVGAFFTVRVSSFLVAYNVITVLGLALLLPLFARRKVAFFTRLRPEGMRREVGRSLGAMLIGPFAEVSGAVDAAQGAFDKERALPVLRGLAFGALAATVFVSLFASADRDFDALIGHAAFDLDGTLIARALSVGLWCLALLGLGVAGRRRSWAPRAFKRRAVSSAGAITALAMVNAVFAAFVVLQLAKVLGVTEALLDNPSALSSAAREGFFQLLWVVALVFALILGLDRRLAPSQRTRAVMLSQMALIGLTLLVAASALLRMHRYTEVFGLTELRFHSTAFMGLLVVLLGWMAFTLLRGRRGAFVGFAASSMVVFVLAMNLMNPDALIAESNLARCDHGSWELDHEHLYTLSADAIPDDDALPADLDRYSWHYGAERERALLHDGGWRAYNLARERAAKVATPAAR